MSHNVYVLVAMHPFCAQVRFLLNWVGSWPWRPWTSVSTISQASPIPGIFMPTSVDEIICGRSYHDMSIVILQFTYCRNSALVTMVWSASQSHTCTLARLFRDGANLGECKQHRLGVSMPAVAEIASKPCWEGDAKLRCRRRWYLLFSAAQQRLRRYTFCAKDTTSFIWFDTHCVCPYFCHAHIV